MGAVPSCGWKGPGHVAPALCEVGSNTENATGDMGYCIQTCNCDADCSVPGAYCMPNWDTTLAAAAGMKGLCVGAGPAPQPMTCN